MKKTLIATALLFAFSANAASVNSAHGNSVFSWDGEKIFDNLNISEPDIDYVAPIVNDDGSVTISVSKAVVSSPTQTILSNYYSGDSSIQGGGTPVSPKGLHLKDSVFENNTIKSDWFGTVTLTYLGDSKNPKLSHSVINSRFTNNKTEKGYGGAILTTAERSGTVFGNLTIENTQFESNFAGYGGGAVNLDYYDVNIKNSSFIKNEAGTVGGGAIRSNAFSLVITDTDFKDNVAEGNGGAIHLWSGDVTFDDGERHSVSNTVINIKTSDKTYIGNNVTGEGSRGGFMYIANDSKVTFDIADDRTLTIGSTDSTGEMDTIASSSEATLTKSGTGTLTINTVFDGYQGTVSVEDGALELAKDWTSDNATLNIKENGQVLLQSAKFSVLSGSDTDVAARIRATGSVAVQNVEKNVMFELQSEQAQLVMQEKASDASITVSPTAELTDKLGISAEDVAKYAITRVVKKDTSQIAADKVFVAETEANGSFAADVNADGTFNEASIVRTLNQKTHQIGESVAFNMLSWRLEMNDMNKRLGELRDSEGDTGVWARVNAGKQKYEGSKNDFQQLQFGADTKVDALAGAYIGGAFSYTNSDISYVGGDGDNNIYGLSAYASWLGDTGSFMDVVAKVARLESDSKVFGTTADFDTYAYSLSAEIGHRFDIGTVAFVEPQLEVNYGYVDGKGFDTVSSTGVRVGTDVDAVESLVGRVGFRAGFTCPQKKGNAYIHASVLREFDGDVKVSRGDGAYVQDMGDTWFEYGIGGNWNVSPNTQVYADVQRTSGADLSEPWRVNVGARYVF